MLKLKSVQSYPGLRYQNNSKRQPASLSSLHYYDLWPDIYDFQVKFLVKWRDNDIVLKLGQRIYQDDLKR